MVTFERRVGRLVEIRTKGAQDPAHYFGRVIALANELGPTAQVIVCADQRDADLPAPAVADQVGKIILAARPRILRHATLVGETEIFFRQAVRVRNLGEEYKGVRTPRVAVAWLEPALNDAELARLKQFLDGR
jgi:hypothetical protein